ncbi:C-X-C motif chemokine 19 [Osmerus mordax]|uniref:Interleukin-8 n=1 Tax=Osmerus mordax TaxID=8014 RepID=C1BLE9_OSMMO|nr:Interleukin-8 precursor [Osmerus mordax]
MKTCLLLALVAISFTLGNGMPPIGRDYNQHCHCVKLETRVIPPDSLRSVEIRPSGPHCQNIEVIAGLARGEKICLDPDTHWVKRLTRFVVEKQAKRRW